ncbi:hypothetical protein [Dysosmobacter sp.]|uniref:hypothetical protein n=1 Tax=Dysosmobacter sp. TaxID=2591382 RepID=UPI003A8FE177
MTLAEMSPLYAESAEALRCRISELRLAAAAEKEAEAARSLRLRAAELLPLLREMRELTVLTARYYDRSYHKHERYTL